MNAEQILKRKQNGERIKDIAQHFRVTPRTIHSKLYQTGYGNKRKPNKSPIRPEVQYWLDTEGKRLEKEFVILIEKCIIYAKENKIPMKDIGIERLMLFFHDGRISLEGEGR